MSMQIRSIILYGRNGETRLLPLRLDAVNIITGKSRTGKTALLDVIDYCLGRTRCNVPAGVIRNTVGWYALLLQFPDTQAFVARRNPAEEAVTSSDIVLELGQAVSPPAASDLSPNINQQGLMDALGRLMGITPNENVPAPGQTRQPLRATLDHAKFLALQGQSEVASRDFLFHRQGEPFIPQAIKDTLPYFLGAVPDRSLMLRARLREAKQELQRLRRRRLEEEQIRGEGDERARTLVSEAAEAGLIATADAEDAHVALRSIVARPVEITPPLTGIAGGEEAARLRADAARLRRRYQELQDQIESASAFNGAQSLFEEEVQVQQQRLETVNLLPPEVSNHDACPLCQSRLSSPVPATAEMLSSLVALRQELQDVGSRRPRVDDFINGLRGEATRVRESLTDTRQRLNAIESQDQQFQLSVDVERRQAHVVGRISLYLETVPENVVDLSDNGRIDALTQEVERIEGELGDESVQEAIELALSRVSQWMTEGARALDLEYQPNPYRLDLGLLTVVADTDERPVRMNEMGSAENWLGCHLVTHVALHRWFAAKKRPVPRFLFIDQPTSAYYPQDDPRQGTDEDRLAVARMYKWLFESVQNARQKFQLLIVDHADLQEQWFKDAVVERWRGDQALIPANWLTAEGTK